MFGIAFWFWVYIGLAAAVIVTLASVAYVKGESRLSDSFDQNAADRASLEWDSITRFLVHVLIVWLVWNNIVRDNWPNAPHLSFLETFWLVMAFDVRAVIHKNGHLVRHAVLFHERKSTNFLKELAKSVSLRK